MGIETLKTEAAPIRDYLLSAPTGQAQVGQGTGSSFIKPQNSLKGILAGNQTQCSDADVKFREFDRAYLAFHTQAKFGNEEEFNRAAKNFFQKADAIGLSDKMKGEVALAAAAKFENEATGKEAGSKYHKAYEQLFQAAKSRNPDALDRAVRNYSKVGEKAGMPLEIRSATIVKAWGIAYKQKTCF